MNTEISLCEEEIDALEAYGVKREDLLFSAISDMNKKGERARTAVVIASAGVYSLEKVSGEYALSFFSVSDTEGIYVRENISGADLTAKKCDGSVHNITSLTMSVKDDFYLVSKNFERLKKGEDILGRDPEKECFCPKCKRRYPDKNRKFCPECMDKASVIKRMAGFALKYKWRIAAIIAILVSLSVLAVVIPYVSSGFFYDEVLTEGGSFFGKVLFAVALIFILRLLRTLANVANGVITSALSAKMVRDMKRTIFSAIERLSLGYFTSRSTGALMNQVYHDATTVYWFFTDGLPYFAVNVVQFIAVTVIMLFINPLLTLLSMGLFPLVFIMIGRLFDKDRRLHEKRYSRARAMSGMLSDLLSGIRIVKTFSREKSESRRFGGISRNLASAEKKRSLFGNTAYPLVNLLIYLGIVIVWGVGGWMIIKGSFGMTYGKLLTFAAYITMVYDPMYFFVDMVSWASDSMNSMNRLFEVMDATVEVKEKDDPYRKQELCGSVCFKDVRFSYTKNRRVIDGISFDVPAGTTLGIVGKTGAGKSTIANLLIRLYDAEEGEILIDGVNVRDYAFEDLRRGIAIVSQETYLFTGTIYDNISFANPDASREEIVNAARLAGAHEFIVKLPDAYQTMVGRGYKDLSGGEKQRISIARALLRDPRILILDEATAAMDTRTERRIQEALETLSRGRTTIIIAHRLSTLRSADKLIVIKDGRVCESGTHRELVEQKGEYFKLYKLQLDALKNVGVEE